MTKHDSYAQNSSYVCTSITRTHVFNGQHAVSIGKRAVSNENRFKEAFDFIKHVFKVKWLYDDEIILIKAFCNWSNVFQRNFNLNAMFVICILNHNYTFDLHTCA